MFLSIDASGLKEGRRFDFKNDRYTHFVITSQELREDELNLLGQLLASFPHASNDYWTDKFLSLNTEEIPKKLLLLAANAYHEPRGYTVLGAAADKGGVAALQKLIDMGADLNALDVDNKLALHWGIANRKSISEKNSLEAASVVKCLLDNGAKTGISSYQNCTPLQYAKSRGYKAAAKLIQAQMRIYLRGAVIGLFKDAFPIETSGHISNFLSEEDNTNLILTRKDAYIAAESEIRLTMKKSF